MAATWLAPSPLAPAVPRADHIAWLHHGSSRATRWGNLGLWRRGRGSADEYASACEALARAVGQAAGMRAGDTVLSLACGGGEELALWAEAFGARAVIGLELTPSLAAQARARAEAIHTGCEVEVFCADVRRLPALVGGRFDRIVCVDSLYHLGPRAPLLRAARERLFAGGGFAFTDLAIDATSASARRALLRLAAPLAGIAYTDVLGRESMLAQLRAAGFDEVDAQPLDAAVLDGFCAFAARQAQRIGLAARLSLAWRRVAHTAWLIRQGRAAGLGYTIYVGRVAALDGLNATAGSDKATEVSRPGMAPAPTGPAPTAAPMA